eukprot:705746-Pelagomonas_calceolata.AAC.1
MARLIDQPHENGRTVIQAGVQHPISDSKNLVEPDGAGIIDNIGCVKLAAIAAALTHKCTHTHCHRQPHLT